MRPLGSILNEPRFIRRAAAGFGLVIALTALTAIGSGMFARNAAGRREQILATYAGDLTNAYRAQLAAEKMVDRTRHDQERIRRRDEPRWWPRPERGS